MYACTCAHEIAVDNCEGSNTLYRADTFPLRCDLAGHGDFIAVTVNDVDVVGGCASGGEVVDLLNIEKI